MALKTNKATVSADTSKAWPEQAHWYGTIPITCRVRADVAEVWRTAIERNGVTNGGLLEALAPLLDQLLSGADNPVTMQARKIDAERKSRQAS